jgi:hypothetical protein
MMAWCHDAPYTSPENKKNLIDTTANQGKDTSISGVAHSQERIAPLYTPKDTLCELLSGDSVVMIDIWACKTSGKQVDKVLLHNFKQKSLRAMLGDHDAAKILAKYNPQLGENAINKDIRTIDTLFVPRCSNAELAAFFDTDLTVFLTKHETLKKLVGVNKHALISTKSPSGIYCIGVYTDGKLRYAYPFSPGIGGKDHEPAVNGDTRSYKAREFRRFTPMGSYVIQDMDVDRQSKVHDFMTFFLSYYPPRGLGGHWGQLVNGKERSHGCERLVHVYAYLTFIGLEKYFDDYMNGTGLPVIVANDWEPTKQQITDAAHQLSHRNRWEKNSKMPALSAQGTTTDGRVIIEPVTLANFAYLYGLDETGKLLYDTLISSPKVVRSDSAKKKLAQKQ